MSKAITITIDATVPDGFYEANEDNLMGNVQGAVNAVLQKLLVDYYSNNQVGMCVVNVEEQVS